MATGRPVVANRIPTFEQIARDSDVQLVDFECPEAVGVALAHACNTRDVSICNVEKSAQYAWASRAGGMADIYHEVVA
jgi:hypothetical protein